MNKTDLDISIVALESSLDAKIERYFDTLDTDPDVLKQLLADKRSENTRRAYERDVNDFLQTMTGTAAVLILFWNSCTWKKRQDGSVVLKYKA
jgi:integrase/recombinase XerC